jgi:uncharacterized membrane protein YeaQ/YmgE (transglycosylase-associated protein family)
MLISVGQLIVWLLIGLLAGSLAGGLLAHSHNTGASLAVGVIGGILGGLVFAVLGIRIGGDITFALHDLVAGLVGAFVLLALMGIIRR